MTIAPHTIQAAHGSRRRVKRVGRGHGTGRGTMSGRGGKGQRARTGGKSRSAIRAFKKALQKVPKLRGFKSRKNKPSVVTLRSLDRICAEGDVVTPAFLKDKGVIRSSEFGVKALASGKITKKITLQGCVASRGAIKAIESAGGSVTF